MRKVLKLTAPIKAHGEMVSELSFREPVGSDIINCGYPFRSVGSGNEVQRTTDTKSVAAYISDLAQIPPSSVGQLSVADFQEAMLIVLGFLAPTPEPEVLS